MIIKKNYSSLSSITDENLSEYFESCFTGLIKKLDLYACWVCMECLGNKRATYGWGEAPNRCPNCNSSSVYMVATFQSWASKIGEMFEWAFYYLITKRFGIPMNRTLKSCKTHDFEVPDKIGIEAKGSSDHINNPDGSKYSLERPGLLREDTQKKAWSNAKDFKKEDIGPYFYIVTNAMPDEYIGYKNRDIDGVYDVTKAKQLNSLVKELRSKKAPEF